MRKVFHALTFLFILMSTQVKAQLSSDPLQQLVSNVILPEMQKKNIPGMAVAIFYDNQGYVMSFGIADLTTYAPVTGDTIFEIASLTKVFTSTDLAVQVDRGNMRLTDPVAPFLPGISAYRNPFTQVTFLQLATHTSGLPRSPPPARNQSEKSILAYLNQWKPDHPIGTNYLYSNLGYGILGMALANRVRTSYDLMLQHDILQPLGMTSTMTKVPAGLMKNYAQGYGPQGNPTPQLKNILLGGGALRSTATDLLKFLEANLGVNAPQELAYAIQIAQKGYYRVNDKLIMGLGWQRFQANDFLIIDKNGGVPGFSSYIGMLPNEKIGVVILANKSKIQSTEIGRRLLKILAKSLRSSPDLYSGKVGMSK